MMRFGLHALGIGSGARREVIDAVARAAEDAGFATLWAGEHVVMVDRPASAIPLQRRRRDTGPGGRGLAGPARVPELRGGRDRTGSRSRPESCCWPSTTRCWWPSRRRDARCPVRRSSGRSASGIGWSREEFEALGVLVAHRGDRVIEYVEAIRVLWRRRLGVVRRPLCASFDSIRVYPAGARPPAADRVRGQQ